MLLIGFAFLAGVVTVLSPCILPVLPVVLSGGLGGRARPWGVIAGFVASFTVLTLTLSSLVQALGLDPDLLRWVAAGLVAVFGVVLVVPALKDAFLRWTTALVSRTTSRPKIGGTTRAGFWSGLVLGLGLGVVWTPCVGPIMASVITLALSQSVDAQGTFITLAYALGTALPMTALMFGGRTLLTRFPVLSRHSAGIQRGFGVVMLVTALALFTGADRAFSTWVLTTFPSYGSGLTALEDRPEVRAELDRLAGRTAETVSPLQVGQPDPLTLAEGAWIGSPPLTLAGLKGKVVLVDFWTYSCVNCVRTLPYLRSWYEKYADRGLVIVGVHSPEFAFERSEANLRRAMGELGVTWPVVQDNAFGIWTAFQNRYWPAHYLFDRQGNLVETHFGEGNYAQTEAAIAAALGVMPTPTKVSALEVSSGPKTPETYLGYGRGQRFASPEDVVSDAASPYTFPATLAEDQWALGGRWTVGQEASRSQGPGKLELQFQGSRVYLVASPVGGPVLMRVSVDGVVVGEQTVDADRMYTLVDDPERRGGRLSVEFSAPVAVYAFTFG